MGDPEVRAQRCSKVHVNAFISDTLKAGLWLDPFTTLYESYKPINLPCTPCLGKHRLGWVGMVMKVSWPRTLLNWREPLALLSSSRSTPQPLKRSFIPAFIAVSGLSSLTFHWTLLNIFFTSSKKDTWTGNVSKTLDSRDAAVAAACWRQRLKGKTKENTIWEYIG